MRARACGARGCVRVPPLFPLDPPPGERAARAGLRRRAAQQAARAAAAASKAAQRSAAGVSSALLLRLRRSVAPSVRALWQRRVEPLVLKVRLGVRLVVRHRVLALAHNLVDAVELRPQHTRSQRKRVSAPHHPRAYPRTRPRVPGALASLALRAAMRRTPAPHAPRNQGLRHRPCARARDTARRRATPAPRPHSTTTPTALPGARPAPHWHAPPCGGAGTPGSPPAAPRTRTACLRQTCTC